MQKIIHFRKLLPKGSVLVFSLLILSILLVTSLTILSSALLDRKASLSTATSTRSFQVADSGVEEVLYQVYKGSHATLADLAGAITGASCSGSTVSFPSAGGAVTVTFYEDETTQYADGCAGTDWRERVVKIKSEGLAGSNARAVEVAVAAASGSFGGAYTAPSATHPADKTVNPITGDLSCPTGYTDVIMGHFCASVATIPGYGCYLHICIKP